MGWLWFWQGLATNLLAAFFNEWLAALLLAAIVIGSLTFYLRKRKPNLANQLLYGLAAFGVVVVVLCALTFMSALPKERPQLNSSNVGTIVRAWLDHFHLGTRPVSNSALYFAYQVTLGSGIKITVMQTKEMDTYITLGSRVILTLEQKDVLMKMSNHQQERWAAEMYREMLRTRVDHWFVPNNPPYDSIELERRVPITSDLTEDAFMERLIDLSFATSLASTTIALSLDPHSDKNTRQ